MAQFVGFRCQVSAPPPARKAASLIEKETLKKQITNPPPADCKYRTRNNECRSKVFYLS